MTDTKFIFLLMLLLWSTPFTAFGIWPFWVMSQIFSLKKKIKKGTPLRSKSFKLTECWHWFFKWGALAHWVPKTAVLYNKHLLKKQGPKRHKPWPSQKITCLSKKLHNVKTVMRKFWESCEKVVRNLLESYKKVVRKLWESFETVVIKLWEICEKVLRKFWERCEKVVRNGEKVVSNLWESCE